MKLSRNIDQILFHFKDIFNEQIILIHDIVKLFASLQRFK